MPADPIDPGAISLADVTLTAPQLQTLVDAVGTHSGSVRVERLDDGYARIVLLGADGEPTSERLLFPA